MKRQWIIGLFIAVALVQIGTSLSMIVKRESVLQRGEQFKFKVAPVDPYDAFRGRYVALRLMEDKAPVPESINLDYGQRVFAHIAVDEEGFAKFSKVTTFRPHGERYIETRVFSSLVGEGQVLLDLPIDRYYMEEKKAPLAERVYRRHTRKGIEDAYVLVRVKDGLAVIEALYVGGKRIEEAVGDIKGEVQPRRIRRIR